MREPWAHESLKEGNVYIKSEAAYPWMTYKMAMIMSIDYSSGMRPSYKVYCICTDGRVEINDWTRNDFTYMDKLSEAG
jgi:serine/threonine-protein kinase RIO1